MILVFVVDGLRPDSINVEDTPTLHRLREEGVSFATSHAAFPTVTRVNAAVLATGCHPGATGILGNTMYFPEVDRARAFSNDDWKNLVKVDQVTGGLAVLVPSLAERLQARGLTFAAVGSGSTGSSWLLNPRAARGVGVLVNGYLEPGTRVAFPPAANANILARFGAAPVKGGRTDAYDASVDWTETVLRDYVLPELVPDVVINWLTEPDHMQHAQSVGSPEARASIRNDDRHIAHILKTLDALERGGTNVFVVSDHGFGLNTYAVSVADELVEAGLKTGPDSDDVVVASSGQAIGLYVKDHATERVQKIVAFLQSREWIGLICTAPRRQGAPFDPQGSVEGTFSLELINAYHPERGPDVLFTFPWTSARNAHGVQGTDVGNTVGRTGPLTGSTSDHGSMSPWTVRNTMLARGPRFKQGITVRVPAGNVDVVPTILALLGLDPTGVDGRVLHEALAGGPDEEQVMVDTRAYTVEAGAGAYRAVVQISEVDGRRYVDKGWRIR
jgi:predicted AlkP superfamily pyrophosphatase or phosphodiesterase